MCGSVDPSSCIATCQASGPNGLSVYRNCIFFGTSCQAQQCIAQGLAQLDGGTGGGAGGGGGSTGGGSGVGGGGGSTVPAPTNLNCTNLMDPRVTWSGSTTTYYFLNRVSSAPGNACNDSGFQVVNGVVGSNSRSSVCTQYGEARDVLICAVDGQGNRSVSKRINVTCPATAGANGSCIAQP
jgi:hypothetical protein